MNEGIKNTDHWQVYIIQASDDRLYTGITTDMERRWQAHTSGKGGAKFFRGRKPKALRYLENDHNRSSASKREAEIKKLTRQAKQQLIAQQPVDTLRWLRQFKP